MLFLWWKIARKQLDVSSRWYLAVFQQSNYSYRYYSYSKESMLSDKKKCLKL